METQKIKDVLAGIFSIHMAYDKAKADGKIDMNDVGFLIDPITKMPAVLGSAKEAYEEIKDLDEDERKDVNDWIKASFDISDDVLEEKIEAGFDVLLSLAKFVGALSKTDEPAPVEEPVQPEA